jgi:hypothetical protein
MRNTKQYDHLSYISCRIDPLCNYTLLPATVEVLETFLEAILWKTLQPCLAFFMMSAASQKHCPFNDDFSWRNRWTSAGARPGGYGGCYSVVTLFSSKKSLTKTNLCAGALLWRRNELLVLHFSGHFILTASIRWRKMSMFTPLFIVAIHVNYTSEFL